MSKIKVVTTNVFCTGVEATMKLGDRIRFFRVQQNMTQEELANGIISVSYLSKIENNQNSPSEEVANMLCERLGIHLLEDKQTHLLVELMDWYRLMIGGSKSREEVESLYTALKQKVNQSKHSNVLLHFMVFEFRYLIRLLDLDQAEKVLDKIYEIDDLFTEQLDYYLKKFKGLYYYVKQEYSEAFEYYQRAEDLFKRNVFEKLEEADLYYSLGLTSAKLSKNSLCIRYTTHAISIYQALYHYQRSAECQIMLAISYTDNHELEKAEECLLLANTIVDTFNDSKLKTYLKGSIHHNLGYVFSNGEKLEDSIYHYNKSIEYKEQYNDKKTLSSIRSLIEAYKKTGDDYSALQWVKKGLEKLEQQDIEYSYHFKTWEYILTEQTPAFEEFLKKKVIPYFIEIEDHEYVAEYAEILSTYYEEHRKYKQANEYLKLSIRALKKSVPL